MEAVNTNIFKFKLIFFTIILFFLFIAVPVAWAYPQAPVKVDPLSGAIPADTNGDSLLELDFSARVNDVDPAEQVKVVFEIRDGGTGASNPILPIPEGNFVAAVNSADPSQWNISRLTVTNLVAGKTYYYKFKAVNSSGEESGYSSWWGITIPTVGNPVTLPPIPIISDFTGNYWDGQTTVARWTFNCGAVCYGDLAGWTDFYGFKLEYSADGQNWQTLRDSGYTGFNASYLGNGVYSYFYQLSRNASPNISVFDTGDNYFRLSVRVLPAPYYGQPAGMSIKKILYQPENLSAQVTGSSSANLSWYYPHEDINILNYHVWVNTVSNQPNDPNWTYFYSGTMDILDPSTYNFTQVISPLTPGVNNYLRIRVYDNYAGISGPWSDIIAVVPNQYSSIQDIAISNIFPSQVTLSWSYDHNASGDAYFSIERKNNTDAGDGNWNSVGSSVLCVSNSCSFTISGLIPEKNYSFRIMMVPAGNWAYSSAVDLPAIPPPANLQMSHRVFYAEFLDVNWNSKCQLGVCYSPWDGWLGYAGYKLEHSLDGVTWGLVKESSTLAAGGTITADNANGVYKYFDPLDITSRLDLLTNTVHYYRLHLRVFTYLGTSYSAPALLTIDRTLHAPTISASAGVNIITYNFSYPYPGLGAYSTDVQVTDNPGNSSSWVTADNGSLISGGSMSRGIYPYLPGHTYYLRGRVSGVSIIEWGPWSTVISVNTLPAPTISNLTVTVNYFNQAKLNWSTSAGATDGCYEGQRTTDLANPNWTAAWNGCAPLYDCPCNGWASLLIPNTSYYFRVRAYGAAAWSSVANIAMPPAPVVYNTGYSFSTINGLQNINLNWQYKCGKTTQYYGTWGCFAPLVGWDVYANLSSFKLEKSSDQISWAQFGASWRDDFPVSKLTSDYLWSYNYPDSNYNEHYYRVSTGINTYNGIYWSNPTVIVVTKPALVTPVAQPATVLGANYSLINWQYAGVGTGNLEFQIQTSKDNVNWATIYIGNRNLSGSGPFNLNQEIGALDPETTYYARIKAVDRNVDPAEETDWSNEISFVTSPASAPANVSAVTLPTSVVLTWSYNNVLSGKAIYEIEQRVGLDQDAPWTAWGQVICSGASSTCSVTISGLVSGQSYFFRVRWYPSGEWSSPPGTVVIIGPSCNDISFTTGNLVQPIGASQIIELQNKINDCRFNSLALPNFDFSPVISGTRISRLHLLQLRAGVESIYQRLAVAYPTEPKWQAWLDEHQAPALGAPPTVPPNWTDYNIVPYQTNIKIIHFEEIREALLNLK